MSTVNIVKTIKKIYPSCVVLVKSGNFIHVYGKDAYIFSYLFGYKLLEKEGASCCGFPINSISKVESVLEKRKVNYIVVDKRNNYDEEEKYINKQENTYDRIFKKSEEIVTILFRIQNIHEFLLQHKSDNHIEEILEQIEKVTKNEGREI